MSKVIYREKFKKGVVQAKPAVKQNFTKAKYIEVLEMGKMDDGSEFVTYKLVL